MKVEGDEFLNGEDNVIIVVGRLYLFNANTREKIINISNSISWDTALIMDACLDESDNIGAIALVDSIAIEEDYGGFGYGFVFLNQLETIFKNLNISIIGLIAGWYNKDNINVISFYKQNGFKISKLSKDNLNIMSLEIILQMATRVF